MTGRVSNRLSSPVVYVKTEIISFYFRLNCQRASQPTYILTILQLEGEVKRFFGAAVRLSEQDPLSLAASEAATNNHAAGIWCPLSESNTLSSGYKSVASPAMLRGL